MGRVLRVGTGGGSPWDALSSVAVDDCFESPWEAYSKAWKEWWSLLDVVRGAEFGINVCLLVLSFVSCNFSSGGSALAVDCKLAGLDLWFKLVGLVDFTRAFVVSGR